MTYIDIDGTLGDFRKQWFYHTDERIKGNEKQDCAALKDHAMFTLLMPLTPFGEWVKKSIKSAGGDLDFIAVTALQKSLGAAQTGDWIRGRNEWMETNFFDIPIVYVYTLKGVLCRDMNDILVDDSEMERDFWIRQGGTVLLQDDFKFWCGERDKENRK